MNKKINHGTLNLRIKIYLSIVNAMVVVYFLTLKSVDNNFKPFSSIRYLDILLYI